MRRDSFPLVLGAAAGIGARETALTPGSAQDAKTQRSWCSPPPGSRTATVSGWSAGPTICSTIRSWRRCSRSTPRPASTLPAWPRSGRPAPTSRSGPSPCARAVQFHYGYGQFTAKDVVHSHSLMMRPEATATLVQTWRSVEEVKVVNDYQVVFRMKRPSTDLAVRGVPRRRPPDGQQGPVGQGRDRGVRQAAGRDRLLSVRQPAAGPVRHLRASGQPLEGREAGVQGAGVPARPARSRRGWRCCSPARPTSPTCRASCRRTRSRRA